MFISDTITGRHKQAFRVDGKTRELSNMSGTKTPFSCSSDAYGRVTVRNEKPSGLRHLLREMQSRKRINAGASVPITDKTTMMRDVSPSAYARVIGR